MLARPLDKRRPASVWHGTIRALFVLVPLLPAGVGQAAELSYTVSWVGNDLSGQSGWVQQDIAGLWVEPDGTVFTNVPWEEAGGNVQQYRDGQLLGMARHTHGWGYEGGDAVASNTQYLFIVQNVSNEGGGLKGNSWPAKGFTWSGLSRRLRSDIRKPAPFDGGHGKEGDVLPDAFLPVVEFPASQRGGALRGVWATDQEVYVSSPFDGTIKVYDAATMKPLRSWAVDRPDRLCLDGQGNVWVLQRPAAEGGAWKALRFTAKGEPLAQRIEFEPAMRPTAICVDRQGRLVVADAGPDQQLKLYADPDKAPRLAGTFGARGGIFAGPTPGRFGDHRFNQPRAIGVDAQGNLCIASAGCTAGGSTVLESYAPDGALHWRRLGLTFVDLADLDPAHDTDVFTKEEHFTLDWSKPAGLEWSYQGYTVNPLKYPDDPRLHLSPTNALVRTLAGRRFLFVTDMTGENLHVYRFAPATDGETAIPCALFARKHLNRKDGYPPHQPDKGEWLWRDANGNGRIDEGEYLTSGGKDAGGVFTPDDQGTIWHAQRDQIRALPLTGVDERGVPAWDYAKARLYPRPAEFDEVRRLRYLPAADVMLLGGNQGAQRNQHWKPMGPVLACYDRWSTDQRKLRWRHVLPYEAGSKGHESIEPISFDVAGDYVFVGYTRGLRAEGIKWAFVKVLRLSDGAAVGNLTVDQRLGEIGLLDLVESVRAVQRASGEYVVFLEDDAKAKVVMFRWQP